MLGCETDSGGVAPKPKRLLLVLGGNAASIEGEAARATRIHELMYRALDDGATIMFTTHSARDGVEHTTC